MEAPKIQFGSETQTQFAKRMYDARAPQYEDSWHPAYTARITSFLTISPGDSVLDLCCGTGLNVFAAAEKVGPAGSVIGVDVSEGMLAVAREKQLARPEIGKRCRLLAGDVTQLDVVFAEAGLEDRRGGFDWITCSNALVLLQDPAAALGHWKGFLKEDGRMVVDVPHEHNHRAGAVLEKAAKRLGVAMPFNRAWVESSRSLVELAAKEGLEVEKYELLQRAMGEEVKYDGVEEADEWFDKITGGSLTLGTDIEEFRRKARPLFREEWEACAVGGKVEVGDAMYLYVLRKAGQE